MSEQEHLCPWWIGYILANPIRKLFQNPEDILRPYVSEGATVLDFGCAMGYFSIPLAKMVGHEGRVVCVDLQERMLKTLRKRAKKAGVLDRLNCRQCGFDDLCVDDLAEKVDFVLAFAVIHEVSKPEVVLEQLRGTLARGGQLLISEPRGHVSAESFEKTVELAKSLGYTEVSRPNIRRGLSALFRR